MPESSSLQTVNTNTRDSALNGTIFDVLYNPEILEEMDNSATTERSAASAQTSSTSNTTMNFVQSESVTLNSLDEIDREIENLVFYLCQPGNWYYEDSDGWAHLREEAGEKYARLKLLMNILVLIGIILAAKADMAEVVDSIVNEITIDKTEDKALKNLIEKLKTTTSGVNDILQETLDTIDEINQANYEKKVAEIQADHGKPNIFIGILTSLIFNSGAAGNFRDAVVAAHMARLYQEKAEVEMQNFQAALVFVETLSRKGKTGDDFLDRMDELENEVLRHVNSREMSEYAGNNGIGGTYYDMNKSLAAAIMTALNVINNLRSIYAIIKKAKQELTRYTNELLQGIRYSRSSQIWTAVQTMMNEQAASVRTAVSMAINRLNAYLTSHNNMVEEQYKEYRSSWLSAFCWVPFGLADYFVLEMMPNDINSPSKLDMGKVSSILAGWGITISSVDGDSFLVELDRMEREIIARITYDNLAYDIGDGFHDMDYEKMKDISKQLNFLMQLRELYIMVQLAKYELASNVRSVMSGIAGISMSAFVKQVARQEAELKSIFVKLKFDTIQKEITEANKQRQYELDKEAALGHWFGFLITVALIVATILTCGAAGVALGPWALAAIVLGASAIGQAIMDASFIARHMPNPRPYVDDRFFDGEFTEDEFDATCQDAIDMLITTSVFRINDSLGTVAVDPVVKAKIRQIMLAAYIRKMIMLIVESARRAIRNTAFSSLGVFVEDDMSSVASVLSQRYSYYSEALGYKLGLVNRNVYNYNEYLTKQRELSRAILDIAISIVTFALGPLGKVAGAIGTIISLANSLYKTLRDFADAQNDLGDLEAMREHIELYFQNEIDKLNPNDPYYNLRRDELQAICDVMVSEETMLINVGGGFVSTNYIAFAIANEQIRDIFHMWEILIEAQDAKLTLWQIATGLGGPQNFAENITGAAQESDMGILNDLESFWDTYAQRENEINEAKRKLFASVLSLVIEAVLDMNEICKDLTGKGFLHFLDNAADASVFRIVLKQILILAIKQILIIHLSELFNMIAFDKGSNIPEIPQAKAASQTGDTMADGLSAMSRRREQAAYQLAYAKMKLKAVEFQNKIGENYLAQINALVSEMVKTGLQTYFSLQMEALQKESMKANAKDASNNINAVIPAESPKSSGSTNDAGKLIKNDKFLTRSIYNALQGACDKINALFHNTETPPPAKLTDAGMPIDTAIIIDPDVISKGTTEHKVHRQAVELLNNQLLLSAMSKLPATEDPLKINITAGKDEYDPKTNTAYINISTLQAASKGDEAAMKTFYHEVAHFISDRLDMYDRSTPVASGAAKLSEDFSNSMAAILTNGEMNKDNIGKLVEMLNANANEITGKENRDMNPVPMESFTPAIPALMQAAMPSTAKDVNMNVSGVSKAVTASDDLSRININNISKESTYTAAEVIAAKDVAVKAVSDLSAKASPAKVAENIMSSQSEVALVIKSIPAAANAAQPLTTEKATNIVASLNIISDKTPDYAVKAAAEVSMKTMINMMPNTEKPQNIATVTSELTTELKAAVTAVTQASTVPVANSTPTTDQTKAVMPVFTSNETIPVTASSPTTDQTKAVMPIFTSKNAIPVTSSAPVLEPNAAAPVPEIETEPVSKAAAPVTTIAPTTETKSTAPVVVIQTAPTKEAVPVITASDRPAKDVVVSAPVTTNVVMQTAPDQEAVPTQRAPIFIRMETEPKAAVAAVPQAAPAIPVAVTVPPVTETKAIPVIAPVAVNKPAEQAPVIISNAPVVNKVESAPAVVVNVPTTEPTKAAAPVATNTPVAESKAATPIIIAQATPTKETSPVMTISDRPSKEMPLKINVTPDTSRLQNVQVATSAPTTEPKAAVVAIPQVTPTIPAVNSAPVTDTKATPMIVVNEPAKEPVPIIIVSDKQTKDASRVITVAPDVEIPQNVPVAINTPTNSNSKVRAHNVQNEKEQKMENTAAVAAAGSASAGAQQAAAVMVPAKKEEAPVVSTTSRSEVTALEDVFSDVEAIEIANETGNMDVKRSSKEDMALLNTAIGIKNRARSADVASKKPQDPTVQLRSLKQPLQLIVQQMGNKVEGKRIKTAVTDLVNDINDVAKTDFTKTEDIGKIIVRVKDIINNSDTKLGKNMKNLVTKTLSDAKGYIENTGINVDATQVAHKVLEMIAKGNPVEKVTEKIMATPNMAPKVISMMTNMITGDKAMKAENLKDFAAMLKEVSNKPVDEIVKASVQKAKTEGLKIIKAAEEVNDRANMPKDVKQNTQNKLSEVREILNSLPDVNPQVTESKSPAVQISRPVKSKESVQITMPNSVAEEVSTNYVQAMVKEVLMGNPPVTKEAVPQGAPAIPVAVKAPPVTETKTIPVIAPVAVNRPTESSTVMTSQPVVLGKAVTVNEQTVPVVSGSSEPEAEMVEEPVVTQKPMQKASTAKSSVEDQVIQLMNNEPKKAQEQVKQIVVVLNNEVKANNTEAVKDLVAVIGKVSEEKATEKSAPVINLAKESVKKVSSEVMMQVTTGKINPEDAAKIMNVVPAEAVAAAVSKAPVKQAVAVIKAMEPEKAQEVIAVAKESKKAEVMVKAAEEVMRKQAPAATVDKPVEQAPVVVSNTPVSKAERIPVIMPATETKAQMPVVVAQPEPVKEPVPVIIINDKALKETPLNVPPAVEKLQQTIPVVTNVSTNNTKVRSLDEVKKESDKVQNEKAQKADTGITANVAGSASAGAQQAAAVMVPAKKEEAPVVSTTSKSEVTALEDVFSDVEAIEIANETGNMDVKRSSKEDMALLNTAIGIKNRARSADVASKKPQDPTVQLRSLKQPLQLIVQQMGNKVEGKRIKTAVTDLVNDINDVAKTDFTKTEDIGKIIVRVKDIINNSDTKLGKNMKDLVTKTLSDAKGYIENTGINVDATQVAHKVLEMIAKGNPVEKVTEKIMATPNMAPKIISMMTNIIAGDKGMKAENLKDFAAMLKEVSNKPVDETVKASVQKAKTEGLKIIKAAEEVNERANVPNDVKQNTQNKLSEIREIFDSLQDVSPQVTGSRPDAARPQKTPIIKASGQAEKAPVVTSQPIKAEAPVKETLNPISMKLLSLVRKEPTKAAEAIKQMMFLSEEGLVQKNYSIAVPAIEALADVREELRTDNKAAGTKYPKNLSRNEIASSIDKFFENIVKSPALRAAVISSDEKASKAIIKCMPDDILVQALNEMPVSRAAEIITKADDNKKASIESLAKKTQKATKAFAESKKNEDLRAPFAGAISGNYGPIKFIANEKPSMPVKAASYENPELTTIFDNNEISKIQKELSSSFGNLPADNEKSELLMIAAGIKQRAASVKENVRSTTGTNENIDLTSIEKPMKALADRAVRAGYTDADRISDIMKRSDLSNAEKYSSVIELISGDLRKNMGSSSLRSAICDNLSLARESLKKAELSLQHKNSAVSLLKALSARNGSGTDDLVSTVLSRPNAAPEILSYMLALNPSMKSVSGEKLQAFFRNVLEQTGSDESLKQRTETILQEAKMSSSETVSSKAPIIAGVQDSIKGENKLKKMLAKVRTGLIPFFEDDEEGEENELIVSSISKKEDKNSRSA